MSEFENFVSIINNKLSSTKKADLATAAKVDELSRKMDLLLLNCKKGGGKTKKPKPKKSKTKKSKTKKKSKKKPKSFKKH